MYTTGYWPRHSSIYQLTLAMMLLSSTGFSRLSNDPPPNAYPIIEGTIERDVDGDTVWVYPDNRNLVKEERGNSDLIKIRMTGMDAPESNLPGPQGFVGQGQFGEEAKEALVSLIPEGATVSVEDQGEDKYHRTLGVIFHRGRNINLEMVKMGWAVPYHICSGPSCNKNFFKRQRVDEFVLACNEARSEERGIFNPKKPLREMPFEFRLRIQQRQPDKYVGNYQTKKLFRPTDYKKIDLCDRIFFLNVADAKRAGFSPAF